MSNNSRRNNNSVVPNTFNTRVSNTNIPNSSVSSGSGSNSVNRRGNNNRRSNVRGRGGGPFNVVYTRPRVAPQVPSNPNNNANSHFNVAQRRLQRVMVEYNDFMNQLYDVYMRGIVLSPANHQAVTNRIANYQRRIAEESQRFAMTAPF